jgi:hypothetical protein
VLAAVIIGWAVVTNISINNKEARLRNTAGNAEKNCEQVFAQGWLKVKGVAKVDKAQEETLKKIYADRMASTGGGKGSLATSFTEAQIVMPQETRVKVMSVIETFRDKFEYEQTKLLNIKNEHDNLRTTWPGTWFVSNKTPLEVKIITSAQAKEAYSTGEDNESDPYGK